MNKLPDSAILLTNSKAMRIIKQAHKRFDKCIKKCNGLIINALKEEKVLDD